MRSQPLAEEPGRADARANRRRVLDAARAVFNEQGADAEMREVAARAEVGLATIYRGFGSKDGLLTALAHDTLDEVFALLAAAEEESSPAQGLRAFLSDALTYVSANGPLFDFIARAGPGWFPGDPRAVHTQFSLRLQRLLQHGVATGDFRPDLQFDVVAHLIFGSLVTAAHSGSLRSTVSAERFAAAVLQLLT